MGGGGRPLRRGGGGCASTASASGCLETRRRERRPAAGAGDFSSAQRPTERRSHRTPPLHGVMQTKPGWKRPQGRGGGGSRGGGVGAAWAGSLRGSARRGGRPGLSAAAPDRATVGCPAEQPATGARASRRCLGGWEKPLAPGGASNLPGTRAQEAGRGSSRQAQPNPTRRRRAALYRGGTGGAGSRGSPPLPAWQPRPGAGPRRPRRVPSACAHGAPPAPSASLSGEDPGALPSSSSPPCSRSGRGSISLCQPPSRSGSESTASGPGSQTAPVQWTRLPRHRPLSEGRAPAVGKNE